MRFEQAVMRLRSVGASKATGDELCAMYAELISTTHGGDAPIYYKHLQRQPMADASAKLLLADRAAAWDVLMGC